MFVTAVLLLAAMGLLIASLGTGHVGLAWGSVVLSAVAAALVLRRWRRSWLRGQDAPEDAQKSGPLAASGTEDVPQKDPHDADTHAGDNQTGYADPSEEDTDAADLLVVYELTDEVLVVDEQPRYHLARCRWPDHARAERLPVREARELGFTPCDRCRPDTTLARKHRAARATAAGSS
ncbi:MAG: hypothetical protein ACRDRI_08920 [Pseudonocardiaceae bacterium]